MKTKNMKQCSILAFIFLLMFVYIIATPRSLEAASINKRAGKAYAKIIQKYMDTYKIAQNKAFEYDADYNYYYKGKSYSDINSEFIYAAYPPYGEGEDVIYRIMDWNKDGTPDLFVGLSHGTIYDVYTFNKGKAVRLMKDIGYRTGTCILCEDGIIADFSSGSASAGQEIFHRISENKQLIDIVTLSSDETEYDQIHRQYYKPIRVKFYKADSKAVRKIKNGTFSYKNQKTYKITGGV